jgi:hypothetical protein
LLAQYNAQDLVEIDETYTSASDLYPWSVEHSGVKSSVSNRVVSSPSALGKDGRQKISAKNLSRASSESPVNI